MMRIARVWALLAPTLLLSLLQADHGAATVHNIAQGKAYRLAPRPNYPACTDAGDSTQLTDGAHLSPWPGPRVLQGRLWEQRSAVGWRNAPQVDITIDLERDMPISGISLNTAAGAGGVEFPCAIHIFVSQDDTRFHHAGDLVALSTKSSPQTVGRYVVHRFISQTLAAHGRYVKLVIVAAGPFIFADEVEVYEGDPSFLARRNPGEPVTDVKTFIGLEMMNAAVARRFRRDIEDVGALLADASVAAEERQRLSAELAAISYESAKSRVNDPDSFRTVLPLNDLHARLFRVQAAVWRALGGAAVIAWKSPLWDPLSLVGVLPRSPQAPAVEARLMQGEYRADAFNLSNTTEREITLRLRFRDLPAGDRNLVTVHEVAWTDTKIGLPVASALPEATQDGEDILIHVPSGMTRQVWLTFHPTGVAPGKHLGEIVLRAAGLPEIVLPLRLWISPLRFPTRPTLQLGGWDYTNAERYIGLTPENRDPFVTHLREHFVDTPWATSAVMPTVPHFESLDRWLRLWPDARNYRIFLNVDSTFDGKAMGTGEFDQAVGAWISTYVSHLKQRGLRASQVGLLLVDEPSAPAQDSVIIAWARALKAAEPEILIWEDPTHANPALAVRMFESCDTLCLNRPMFLFGDAEYRRTIAKQRTAGRVVNFYSCSGPVQSLDPYTYHRLQAWTSWQQGATAEFFWAFGDNGGGSTWNEYAAPGTNYSPLFLDDRTVTPGKHMEAIREGVQDYEYLVMLRDRIDQLESADQQSASLTAAKRLLATAADRVLNAPAALSLRWEETKDRAVADRVRLEMLDALEAFDMGER